MNLKHNLLECLLVIQRPHDDLKLLMSWRYGGWRQTYVS